MLRTLSFTLICWLGWAVAGLAQTSSPVGVWKTVDDKTGEARSHIEIYEQNGRFHGKVVRLLQRAPDTRCENCTGARKNQPLVGMVVVENLQARDGHWKNGVIMDPESGSEYGCSVWFESGQPNQLKVRGRHWTGIYRTQTWHRVR